jgi:transketolase
MGLDNLTAIVDRNRISLDGRTEEINALEPFADKWRAFGWQVIEADGHDIGQLFEGLQRATGFRGRPTVLVANTVKGKGISFLEDTHLYHYAALSDDQLAQARLELGREN